MLTDLYLKTTDPNIYFMEMFDKITLTEIIISTLFHTFVYTLFLNLVFFIFTGKFLSNVINARLVASLIVIMFFGFFARFFHVKEIYKAYNYDLVKTRNHLDKLYIGWIFIS